MDALIDYGYPRALHPVFPPARCERQLPVRAASAGRIGTASGADRLKVQLKENTGEYRVVMETR